MSSVVVFVGGFAARPEEPGVAEPFFDEVRQLKHTVIYAPIRRDTVIPGGRKKTPALIEAQTSYILDSIEREIPEGDSAWGKPWVIIGHSLGCMYAVALAKKLEEKVGRIRAILLSPAGLYDQSLWRIGKGLLKKSIHLMWHPDPAIKDLAFWQAVDSIEYFGFPPHFRLLAAEVYAARSQILDLYLHELFHNEKGEPINPSVDVWVAYPTGDLIYNRSDVTMILRRLRGRGINLHQLEIQGLGHDAHLWAQKLAGILHFKGLLDFD